MFRARHLGQGFTLIEIMVGMVIISVMTGIAVMNMPQATDTAAFDAESKRLKLVLEMASEEAVVQGIEFGFKLDKAGYSFYSYDEVSQKWSAQEDSPFEARELEPDLELELDIDGEKLVLGEKAKVPEVLILSSGETTPFELALSRSDDLKRTLKTEGYGVYVWLDDEEK